MKTIEYFKLQSKNLYKDFKTQKPYYDFSLGGNSFKYTPKFFDVYALLIDFEIDENHFTLMNAQHIIANLAGFRKWNEMIKASPEALELAKLLLDNMHKISIEEWEFYISGIENDNDVELDDEWKLDIFKTIYADVDGHQSFGRDYRIVKREEPSTTTQNSKPKKKKAAVKITSLPLSAKDREKFIKTADSVFEYTVDRIEPDHPEIVRKLWNAEKYIDELLEQDMLPIYRDYALSLIDASLVHHVIDLAVQADEQYS